MIIVHRQNGNQGLPAIMGAFNNWESSELIDRGSKGLKLPIQNYAQHGR